MLKVTEFKNKHRSFTVLNKISDKNHCLSMSSGKIHKKRLSEKRLFLADFFAHRVMDLPLRGVVTSDDLSNSLVNFGH